MNDELKPCPLCKGPAIYTNDEGMPSIDNVRTAWCTCDDIFCTPDGVRSWVDNWNTRPIESALRAQLAQAQGEIERLRDDMEKIREALPGKNIDFASAPYAWGIACEVVGSIARRALERAA